MSSSAADIPVAIFVEDLGGGGAEKISVTLVNGLAARGIAVDLLMWRAEGPYLAKIDPAVRQINLSATGPARVTSIIAALLRYFKVRSPKVFLSQLEKPSLVAIVAALLAGYRHVVPCVHIDLLRYTRHGHKLRRMILVGLVTLLYRFVPQLVAVSNGAAASLRRLLWPTCPDVAVVYNGFDFKALREEAALPVEAEWLRHKTVPVIIACGRLVPQKAYDLLLGAFARVRQKMAARLIILGEGPLRAELEAQIQSLGLADSVLMPGYVAKPASWFAKSDLFVLSSRNEGLSNVLVEALAVGLPVVSTDCPSGPREVLADGRYGRLVAVNDADALAMGILAALQTPAAQPAVGRMAYLEKFSAASMIDNYLRVINGVK